MKIELKKEIPKRMICMQVCGHIFGEIFVGVEGEEEEGETQNSDVLIGHSHDYKQQ